MGEAVASPLGALAGLGGGGGGDSGGGGGFDPTGGGGGGGFDPGLFDPSSMAFDPSGGMSGGFGGFDPGAFTGSDPTGSFGAQQAIQGPQQSAGGTQSLQGDQPGIPSGPQQANMAPQGPQQPQQINVGDLGHILMRGPSLSAAPGGPAFAQAAPQTMTDASGPGGPASAQAAPTIPDTSHPGLSWDAINPAESFTRVLPPPRPIDSIPAADLPPPATPPKPSVTVSNANKPSVTVTDAGAATPPAAGGATTPPAAGGAAPPATGPVDKTGASGPLTEQGAPQAGGAPQGGGMPQSPLEQIVGQFMQMLLGGGRGGPLSALEHMLARALGINPNLLPQFPFGGNPFNRPVPPGFYPPGTTGGRSINPQPGSQPGAPPSAPPGPPGTPGNQSSALPPRRTTEEEAAPWHQGEPYNPNAPGATGAGGAGGAGDATQFIRDRGGHPAGVGAPDLNPQFAKRLAAAGRAYEQETGQKANFGEMGRSRALQSEYYQRFLRGEGRAAPPGTSQHEKGMATDIPSGPFQNWMHRNAARFGLEGLRRSLNDPFHFQVPKNMRGQFAQAASSTAPTAGSGGQRIEVNPDAYEKSFAGTPLAGQSDAVTQAARANNIPPSLLASVMAEETGFGRSSMLRTMNNPGGIVRGGGGYAAFPTVRDGINATAHSLGRIYQQTGGDINRIAHIYAPPGRNDPRGTNREWPRAVMQFQQTLGM